MIQALKKVKDMATAGNSGVTLPDWILRGVVAVVLAGMFLTICGAAIQDHTQVWKNTDAIKLNGDQISEIKDKSKVWDQTPTDIAVIKQQLVTANENQKEILRLLREKKDRRND